MSVLSIKKYSLYTIYGCLVAGVTLASFGAVSSYVDNKRREASYEQLPISLKLKAPAENVIHSEVLTTKSGEEILRYAYIEDPVESVENEDVARRTPNSQTVVLGTREEDGGATFETLKTTFYAKPQLYRDKGGEWKHIEYATTTPETFALSGAIPHIKRRELVERILGVKPVFADTATYYPDPSVETTSVDGDNHAVGNNPSAATAFSNAQTALTGTADDTSTTMMTSASNNFVISEYVANIRRIFVLFDTSALADTTTISSATVSFYATTKANTDDDASDTLNLVTSTPAANTAVAAGDFDQVGTTLQATALDITSVTASAYNAFTLNATGIANISLTSITKFAVREGHDLANSTVADGTVNSVTVSSADNTGTTQDPKLDVTYSVPTFSTGDWFPF